MNTEYNHEEEIKKAIKEIDESKGIRNTEEKAIEESLNKTITLIDGTEIKFHFEKITGNTIIKVKEEFKKLKKKEAGISIEELDDMYYILVAEKVSAHSRDYYLALKYKDYNLVKGTVRDFLNED
ncbi:MAG: hypothetical protein CR959_00495 [Fusobacteriales bacterium]|nr:MAG: hypothetical protein CR959_00495 [Fusobacteriales bacterium]